MTEPSNIFVEFKKTCQASSQKVCLKFKKGEAFGSLTYGGLYQKVLRYRRALLESGIRPGERVALLLSNGPYWPVGFFSLMSVQAVAVPIDVQLSPEDVRGILRHSESRLLLTEEKFGIALGEILAQSASVNPLFLDRLDHAGAGPALETRQERYAFGEDKLAALFYTSGTTREHKAVMLTHGNLLSDYRAIAKVDVLKKDDVVVSLLPLHHTYPFMVTCLAPLLAGGTVCYLQSMVHHELFARLKENKVTIFVGVPQMFSLLERSIAERMKRSGPLARWSTNRVIGLCFGLSRLSGRNVCKHLLKELHETFGGNLRLMTSGGAKLDPAVARSFYRMGFEIIEGYGLTETSPVATFMPLRAARFDSVGKALPGVGIKVVRPDENGIGEIALSGPNVMLGYYRAPALTRQVLRDGWFLTGDMGYLDRRGYLYITGRINELIVLPSGKKINPEAVEAHYLRSPFIKEMCVMFAKPGAEAGHLAAVIVPNEDQLKAAGHVNIHFKIKWELDSYAQKLAPYQRIRGFVLTQEALPRTRLGKLIRYKIEQSYASGAYEQAQAKGAPETERLSRFEERALAYLSKILKRDVGIDDHLELDLGMDSLGRIELLSALQNIVNVGIDDSLAMELFAARTVRELIEKARSALPESAFSGFVKREDLVFWPHVLREMPSEENRRKLKLRFDLFDACVTWMETLLLQFLFRALFSVRVIGKGHIPSDGPFVITSNHVSFLDAFFILCALPHRLILKAYFVGFGDIFNHPLLKWAGRFHRLVPIDANIDLAETLKACRYILEEGKVLVIFPEGQRSIDGKLKEFRKGIGILLKESGAKALPFYLAGAYAAWPRTRAFPLPADVTVKIGPVVLPQDLKISPEEDPYAAIALALREKTSALAS